MSETEKPSQEKEEISKNKTKENNENISVLIFLLFYSRVEAWVQWFPPHTGSTELVNHF